MPAQDHLPRLDVLNALLTAIFQLALALVPFYLFLRRWPQLWIWLGVVMMMSVILYFTWYKNLPAADETSMGTCGS